MTSSSTEMSIWYYVWAHVSYVDPMEDSGPSQCRSTVEFVRLGKTRTKTNPISNRAQQ